MKNLLSILLALVIGMSAKIVYAQNDEALESESRNIASAFMGAANFVVGKIGTECLALLDRIETPREFVNAWQERNLKYYSASTKYMAMRMEAAFALGGPIARDAVLRDYSAVVRKEGEATIAEWFKKKNRGDGCQRAVTFIDNGMLDVSPEVPVFQDLEALANWAKANKTLAD
jgi:hypothetical protein